MGWNLSQRIGVSAGMADRTCISSRVAVSSSSERRVIIGIGHAVTAAAVALGGRREMAGRLCGNPGFDAVTGAAKACNRDRRVIESCIVPCGEISRSRDGMTRLARQRIAGMSGQPALCVWILPVMAQDAIGRNAGMLHAGVGEAGHAVVARLTRQHSRKVRNRLADHTGILPVVTRGAVA